jgi:hypothetical protein
MATRQPVELVVVTSNIRRWFDVTTTSSTGCRVAIITSRTSDGKACVLANYRGIVCCTRFSLAHSTIICQDTSFSIRSTTRDNGDSASLACFLADCQYDSERLEDALQRVVDPQRRMFDVTNPCSAPGYRGFWCMLRRRSENHPSKSRKFGATLPTQKD